MTDNIERLKKAIGPLRQDIIDHKVYSVINDIDDLKVFMRYHVYAVWDFMSLLKTLQQDLTCTSAPWFPKGLADTRYLINEIVIGEESDIDQEGNRKSHFELYLDAMRQCGADTAEIDTFITVLKERGDLQAAFTAAGTPKPARDFVGLTFEMIDGKKNHLQSAVFTFGREDLIPGMFLSMVRDINKNFPDAVSIFKYYLERHIEVDGDHHSDLALQMTASLCADNDQLWAEAEQATIRSLQKRIDLWNAVYDELMLKTSLLKN